MEYYLGTQIVALTLTTFQDTKNCIQFIAIHPHKPILYSLNNYDDSNFIKITWSGDQM